MNAEYKRNLQNNYLVIEIEEEAEEQYCMQMAENNHITGLLSFQSIRTDGKLYLEYEITSRQSLEQIYEKKQMSGKLLIWILRAVSKLLETMQEYLLNPVHILLDPKYIYVCTEQQTLHFCYLPEKEPENSVSMLAEFLLKHLDHEDIQAVQIGYEFYQCVQEENFSLKRTLKEILQKENLYKDNLSKENINNENINKANIYKADIYKDKIYNGTEGKGNRYKDNINHNNISGAADSKCSKGQKDDEHKGIYKTIHLVVLISFVCFLVIAGFLYYFRWINLTEAGGLFFLLIFIELLISQLWKKQKNKEKEESMRWTGEEENGLYRMLQEEMYGENLSYDTPDYRKEKEVQRDSGEIQRLRLIPVSGKNREEIIVKDRPVLIGKRKGESDVILDSPTVSRTHALLERKGSLYFVCDMNSKNGTFCNGQKILPQNVRQIEQNDLIAFAELEYRAVFYSESDSA